MTHDDYPDEGGLRPLRACGTRFIAHKVAALERILDRYGAYINHVISLISSPATKPVDRQKLKGYMAKWQIGKLLIGCALFHDILKPAPQLCKTLQSNEVSVVSAIQAMLRTSGSMERLTRLELENFPSVNKVLSRFKESEDGSCTTYQGVDVARIEQGKTFLKTNYRSYIDKVLNCLRHRLKPTDSSAAETSILTHSLKVIATHGWDKSDDASFGIESVEILGSRFSVPLQQAGVNCALLQEEWIDLLYYAKQYINIVKDPYRVVWWKLFNSNESSKWTNILSLVELIFCIPLSNGHVERCFSQLKITKTSRRTSLKENRLDQLLRIRIEGPSLQDWDSTNAVKLWWEKKCRRTETSRSGFRKRTVSERSPHHSDSEEIQVNLSDWENWLESESDDNAVAHASITDGEEADISDNE